MQKLNKSRLFVVNYVFEVFKHKLILYYVLEVRLKNRKSQMKTFACVTSVMALWSHIYYCKLIEDKSELIKLLFAWANQSCHKLKVSDVCNRRQLRIKLNR